MFPASCSSKATAACAVMMMMMMMMMMMADAAAMPKTTKSHRMSTDGATVETVPLLLDPSALVHPRNLRPLENASISPWTYNVTSDSSLLTPLMSEAHCLLTGCLNLEGKEDQNLRSVPIKHQVLVLRRIKPKVGHSYHFRLESRLIAVGCTCVRPMVQVQ